MNRPSRTPERGGVDAPFYRPESLLNSVGDIDPDFHRGAFDYLANSLQVAGASFAEICEKNAEVRKVSLDPRVESSLTVSPDFHRLTLTPKGTMRASCGRRSRCGSMMSSLSCPSRRLPLLPPSPSRQRRSPPPLSLPDSTIGCTHLSPLPHPHRRREAATPPVDSPSLTRWPSASAPITRLVYSRPKARSHSTTFRRSRPQATTILVHHCRRATATTPT